MGFSKSPISMKERLNRALKLSIFSRKKEFLLIASRKQSLKIQNFAAKMKLRAIKNIIGSLAPRLGQALSQPLGSTAASAIAQVLGGSTKPKALDKAVQAATPEQLSETKKADNNFEVRKRN